MAKTKSRWFENALLVGVAGSMIALVGTFAGAIMPIMYGPEDISDFSINLDHISQTFDVQNCTKDQYNSEWVNIKVEDFHKWLRPYRFMIHFQALGPSINDTYAYFDPPDIRLPGPLEFGERKSSLNWSGNYRNYQYMPLDTVRVRIKTRSKAESTYPIIIQGYGGDGKIRNATFYLRILNHEDFLKSKAKELPILGDEIHN